MQSSVLFCRRFVHAWLRALIVSLVACPSLWAQSLVNTGSQPFAVAVNPATNKIYVVNNGQNTVTVIDGATNTTRTVTVGRTPVGIAVNPVTNEVYVANSGDGTVTVINEAQGSVRNISVGLNPQAIIVNPVTNKIYVAAANGNATSTTIFNQDGNVVVIDGRTDTVRITIEVGRDPFALALNPVTNRIYVANAGLGIFGTVSVIDGSNDTLSGSPVVLGDSPHALAINPVTNKIYVINARFEVDIIDGASNTFTATSFATTGLLPSTLTAIVVNPVTNFIYVTESSGIGTVIAVNGATNAISGVVPIGNNPEALAVNSLTNRIYVTDNATLGHVVVIDGSTNTRVASISTGNSPGAVAVNPLTNRVYIANYRDDNVAVVDGATTTTNTITAGGSPYAVALNQVTNKVYVPNMGDNTVTVIDAANGGTTSTLSTGTGPTAVAVNPATNKIYVPNSGSANVTVIDGLNSNATTQVSAGQGPFAVAVDTASNKAYVTNSVDGTVTVIDGTNQTSNITVGTAPKGLAINEVTDTIVVANQGSNNVTVINGTTNATTTVPAGSSPVAVGVNPAENNFYVVNQGSNNVTVIDGDTLERIDLISVGNSPGAVVVNPLINRIYVANQSDNTVSVIDGAAGNVIATVRTGNSPNALDLNPLNNRIDVANQSDGTVTVIDGTGNTVTATVTTGSAPSGVAVNPIANQVYVSNRGSGSVTVISVGAQQSVPLTVALAPVVSSSDTFTSGGVFSTFNETPTFNVTVTSAYTSSPPYTGYIGATNPPPTQVYFSADGVTPWSLATPTSASGSNPANFTITLGPQDSGLHALYVFAAYANEGGHNSSGNGTGNSPEISNLQGLPVLVLPTATTTALVSDAPNGAQENTRITFTATVTANSNPVTVGTVQFYADGKTQGLPIQVNSSGVAIDTNNTLTSGSHTIQAVYLGTDQFLESSASLTQEIFGLPTSITVSSGNNQSAAVNTNYASPLVAIVKDQSGNPVSNVTVTWATNGTATAPGGTLSAATSTTDANGFASVNVTANSKAGSFQVTASAVGPPSQFTLTNTAGAATSITIHSGSSPQSTVISTQFAQPLTVFVTDAGSNPVQGVTVTYVANGTTANASLSASSAVTDSGGLASVIATANGTTGSYTVTAAAGSVGSVSFALRNSAAATSTSLAPPTQTAIYGNTINFTATVNQPAATGSVDFFLGTELLGAATLNAGSATLALNQIPGTGQYLPVGTYSNITATYTGDTNFGGSSSVPVTVTVTKRTGAGALTVVANSVTRQFGQPNPAFSYTVQGTLVSGDTAASAVTGTAVYTTSAVPGSLVGTYPLSVSGLVSANYDITFQDGTVTVTQGNSTTTIATASTNIMYGDQDVLTAAVTQGATGTVSFYEGSTLLGIASLDSATQAELPIDNLPAGVHTITATFNGGPNLLPSTSSPATLTVTQRTGDGGAPALTIVVRNATRPASAPNPPFSYFVTGQLFNNDTYGTAISGTAVFSAPAGSDPGTYPITISGLTSNNYTTTIVSGTLSVTDDAIGLPSTTTLTVNPSSGQYGDPITLTATMSPTVASGRVSFYDGTVFIGDATLSSGTATFVATTLYAGTHSVTAVYSGDGIYSTSVSPPMTVTVAKKQGSGGGAALTITVQNASRQFGTANPYFAYIVTGTLLPGDSYDSAVTGVAVYATTDTPSSAVGTTYPITVTGLISQNYEIATLPGTLTIVAASSTTTLSAAQTTGFTAAQYGDTVTLTATVAPTTATGTVVFLEGQNVLGTAPVGSGTGVGSLALTTLQTGRHTITAAYLGDNNLGTSTSTPVTIVVSQKTGPSGEPYLIVTPNNTSRAYGQANPAFTYTVSGALLNGDTPATAVTGVPIYSTPASLGSPAGTYPVSIVGGLSSLNYLIEFQDGTFTVTPTALTVALASSLNPSTYGGAVVFTATLPIDATGTVTFYDGTAVFGTGTISGGVATQLTNSLTAGTHSITAQYGGDVNYNAAVSTALSQVVNVATPVITLTSSLNPSTFGASVIFTATLPATATGTVTFHDGTTSLGTGTISSGVATFMTTSLTAGTHSITAQYAGDSNYTAAVSTPVPQVVNKTTPTVTLASSLNPSTYGTSVTFTAAVPAGATGTVTFEDNGTAISGAVPISGTTAAFATSTLVAGSHAITAVYSGDSNYNGANSLVLTQTVNMATTGPSTTLSVSPTTVMYGDPAVLTAVVGPPSGATGTVSFHEGATLLGTSSLDGSTTAVLSVSTLNAGTHTITATYNGDVNFPASTSNPVTLTVTQRTGPGGGAALTVTVNDATRTTTEANPPFSHTVAGELVNGDTYATAVTGTPTYATAAGTTAGTFAITVSGLTSQNYVLTVVPGTLTVVPSSSTTTLVASPNAPQYGDPVTLTATVTLGATGTTSFYDSSAFLGEGTVTGGVATLITTSLNAGTHTITAIYNGDATYASSTSGPATVTVAKKTAAGGGPALTVTVENASREYGTANPEFAYIVSGTLVNGDTYATAVTGVPVYTSTDIPTSPVGSTFPINVSGLVSENYTLTTVPGTLTIVTAATTTALTTSVTSTQYGDPVTLTATVAPSSATGTVVFSSGATVLGSGTLSGGTATLSTSGLSVGTYTITASYEGDGNYAESTSSAVTVTVAKRTGPGGVAALTVTVTDASRQYGQGNPAFSYTVSGTLVNGDTYAIAVTGVAVYATPATVTSPVGTYPVSITGGLSSANYSLAFVNGTLTVSQGTPSVTVASSLNPSTYGASVTLTAAVPAGATGTVTFEDNGTAISGAVPISGTTATLTTSTLVEGTHPIIAVYSGDTNYNGATSSALSQVVNQATLTVTANDASRSFGTANPAFTSTITGFVNGDTQASVVTGSPSLTTTATTVSPAGTYPITAALGTLATNNNYIFAFINGTLTVTQATGASTTLSVNPTTVMYGDPAVLTAVVGPPSGATGTVSFYEGTTLLGTASLNSSVTAVLPVSTLNAGTHTITATYNGDASFPASASNPATLTVTQRTAAGGGASLIVTVNDASRTTTQDNPPFSHTVAGELVNGDTYATAVTGTPTYSTTAGTTAGTFAITVSGLTSQNYVLAFVPGTLTVVPASSTTTLASSPNSLQYGDPVTLTATVTSGATGTASFYDGSVYLGQGTVTGGVSTLSTMTLNAGTHTITATYNGDATYASSTSGPATVMVAKKTAAGGGPALMVTVGSESREYGTANPEFSYIVSGTLLNGDTYETAVTGVPVYTSTDTPTSPVGSTFPINVSGLVSQNYTLTTVPGTLTIVTAATTTALTIMTATTTTAQTTSVTSQYGDPATLTATVAPAGATGSVVFSNGSTVEGTATVSGGTATLTTSSQSAGTKTITASYQGDANHAASTSLPVTAIVTPRTGPGGGAALTITVTDATRQYGQGNPAFNYTVTGTLVNGDTYATAVTGVPVYSTTATVTSPVGTYPVSITGGLSSANYSIAFVNGTLTVSKGTPSVTVASSQNPSAPAASVTFTAMLSAGATGTVTFMDGPTVLGTGTVFGSTANFSTTALSVGTHSITAVYGGDANYNGVTSPALSQVVNKTATTVTVASSRNPVPSGSSVTFTATVPAGATGTVQFLDGTTVLGTGTVSGGAASFSTATLSVGTHSITAVYSGDATYSGATSSAVSQVVQTVGGPLPTFTVASTTGPQLIPPGASATYSITVTPVNGAFNNVVTLTATNLPPGSSYTFAPSTLTPGSAGATSTFTVSVPKQSAALRRISKTPLAFAVLLLPLALFERTRARPPRLLLWLLLGLTSFGMISGCGAGGYFNLPQQTYVITVTGTSGNVANSSTVTLTVQ